MPHALLEPTCPREEEFAAFLRGDLASRSRRSLEAHVSRCSACRLLLSALARADTETPHAAASSVSPTLPLESGIGERELPLGARVGRYVVLDWLGAGGMGVVYAAHDPELDRKVALKVLHHDGEERGDRLPIRDLIQREAQAMAQLAHPNVVTVFDVGSVGDRVFIAMELVEGMTLAEWLRARRRDQGEILAAFLAAGNGLAAAHAAGLIHRDFKPDNVLVGNDGRICVTDFGLARPVNAELLAAARRGTIEPGHRINPVRTGLAGTLAYMAPEQYLRRGADARADQFSFAVALFEALHGKRPFARLPCTAEDGAGDGLGLTPTRGSKVPKALRRALRRALSPAPDQRYPSMDELLAVLAPRPHPRRGRVIAVGAVLMMVATITSASIYAIHLQRAADRRAKRVGWLRGLAPDLRTLLRGAHMLPLHDIRPAREQVRNTMRAVERQLASADQDEIALASFVLGEGHRALGDDERAVALLETAWGAGERGPGIDAALGDALGATHERKLDELEHTPRSPRRDAQVRAIEQRYRDPAMAHLRAALAARTGSPAYLEALIAFHDHRFGEASQRAHAAFAESPTSYEAGALEARAHDAAGHQLLASGKASEAIVEFAEARKILARVLEIARSDDDAWLADGEMVLAQAVALAGGGEMSAQLRREALAALDNVHRINPENRKAFSREAQTYFSRAK